MTVTLDDFMKQRKSEDNYSAVQDKEDEAELRRTIEGHWFRMLGGGESVHMLSFPVMRHTPKSVWLLVEGKLKFLLRNKTRRAGAYAAPTREQAIKDFILRKRWYIACLEDKIRVARIQMSLAETNDFREF